MIKNPESLLIKSDKNELRKVEKFLFHLFERNQLPEKFFQKVFLCISEAVVNSIDHGNKNDDSKGVFIQTYLDNSELIVMIRDEGEGFDYKCLDDPTCGSNIKRESGRGIHIIKSISNQVDFDDQG